jgi:predicted HTH domain antitoxin
MVVLDDLHARAAAAVLDLPLCGCDTVVVAGYYYALSWPRLVQKLLLEGMRTARLDHAAQLYARREVTLERAAELAGVSIYEMMSHLRERDILAQRRASDIRADAVAMLLRSGRSDIAERLVD